MLLTRSSCNYKLIVWKILHNTQHHRKHFGDFLFPTPRKNCNDGLLAQLIVLNEISLRNFFAIVNGMNHQFETAAIAIFAALVLDGMDGRVARMTNTQSAFGEQYDSLSDMVSFGVAPALVAYEWVLKDLGKWGWLAAFTYCAGAALRLARFNINTGVVDKKFFQGLPSPAAAALLAGFIWLADDNKLPVKDYAIPWVTFFITVYAGLTMVSNGCFYSGKALDVRYRVPFWVMVLLILEFVLISSNPPVTLFAVFVAYSVSGYVIWAWRRFAAKD